MKTTAITALAVFLSCGIGWAEEAITKTEKTEKMSVSPDGVTREKVKTEKTDSGDKSITYETRLDSAYKYAGLSTEEATKLRDYDIKVRDARRAKDMTKVKTYYEEESRLIKPEQAEKVRVYLREHPRPADWPEYEVTTWEEYQPGPGIGVTTPLGNIGVNAPGRVVEHKEVKPANP